MIKAKDGKVTFRGTKNNIMAEAVTVLHALKESVSEEEYKMVIRLADKSREQLSDEVERRNRENERRTQKVTWIIGGST
jgi:hypothetical protein|nr:MAG TPA: hypothetical protein [Caudoviricetes sp.]